MREMEALGQAACKFVDADHHHAQMECAGLPHQVKEAARLERVAEFNLAAEALDFAAEMLLGTSKLLDGGEKRRQCEPAIEHLLHLARTLRRTP